MTTQTQITCTIRREQMVKGMTSRANLCKELIIWMVNHIVNVLFSHDVWVTSYLTPLWTTAAQRPNKLKCSILAMQMGAAIYWMCARVINCTAFDVLTVPVSVNNSHDKLRYLWTYSMRCKIHSSLLVAFKMRHASRHVKRHLDSIVVDQNPAETYQTHVAVRSSQFS